MRPEAPTVALTDIWRDPGPGYDQVYLFELERRLDELSVRRRVFVSAAHELSHHVLALNGANNTGMAAVFDTVALLARFGQLTSADRLPSFTGAASPAMIVTPKHGGDFVSRLSSWAFSDYFRPPEVWLDGSETGAAKPPDMGGPRVTLRGSIDTWLVLADLRAAVLRLIHALLAMARLCEVEIWMLRRERSHVLAHIGRPPDIRNFVLVILAVCRHYGHRSEPDDHASLLTRRHLVSMGSCPPI